MCAGEKKAHPPASFFTPAPLSHVRLPVFGLSRTKYPPRAIRPNPKIISLGSSPPQPPPLSTTAAQLLTYPLQPCIARTPQLRPFSPVSSSALGRAPPTNSRRRALAGASTHQIQQLLACTRSGGPSPPTDLVVAWEGR
jgi:hypothetical protein